MRSLTENRIILLTTVMYCKCQRRLLNDTHGQGPQAGPYLGRVRLPGEREEDPLQHPRLQHGVLFLAVQVEGALPAPEEQPHGTGLGGSRAVRQQLSLPVLPEATEGRDPGTRTHHDHRPSCVLGQVEARRAETERSVEISTWFIRSALK